MRCGAGSDPGSSVIKFFTARIHSDKFMPASPHDQACYLEALTANPLIQIVEGVYKRFRVKLPFVKEPCVSCGKVEYATVWKTEEKKSDVNLAVEMTCDAYLPASASCRMKSRWTTALFIVLKRGGHRRFRVIGMCVIPHRICSPVWNLRFGAECLILCASSGGRGN